jgi:hypothetical protein
MALLRFGVVRIDVLLELFVALLEGPSLSLMLANPLISPLN